jgi:hypothetical protein
MKRIILQFILGIIFIMPKSVFAYQKVDLLQNSANSEKIKASLVMNQKWVKYPPYSDRQGWEKLLGNEKEEIIRNGEKQLDYKWQVITASDYMAFGTSGSRMVMESPNNANMNAVSALFWAEMAEGKGRFLPKLIDGVFYMCEMTTWILSAHMTLQSHQNSFPDHRENVIDLNSGGCGAMMSWIYYFMHDEFDKVNPMISIRLRSELEKRVLEPYMQRSDFWWQAFNAKPENMVNNWNPWCNSNVLQCFMLLENDPEKLADAVCRTMRSVDSFFNYTKPDGACEEGPSYWDGAYGMAFIYLQLLSEITNGQVSLLNNPRIKRMGEFVATSYIGDGWAVNFADASARIGNRNSPLIYEYGKTVKSDNMMAMAVELYLNGISVGTDIRRSLHYLSIKDEMANTHLKFTPVRYSWYPETQFCYISDNKGNFFAGKGGYNNESHNHNDVGSFIYCIDKTPVIIDAGVGTYTAKTFSSERYTIWTMQSQYHNLPLINGLGEEYGSEYKARDVKADGKSKTFSVNIAHAYSQKAGVKSWIRKYKVISNGLSVSDNFELSKTESPIEIHFLTWGDIDTTVPGKVSIHVQDKKAELDYDKDVFTASAESIHLDDTKLRNVWGEKIYRISLKAKNSVLNGNYRYDIRKR